MFERSEREAAILGSLELHQLLDLFEMLDSKVAGCQPGLLIQLSCLTVCPHLRAHVAPGLDLTASVKFYVSWSPNMMFKCAGACLLCISPYAGGSGRACAITAVVPAADELHGRALSESISKWKLTVLAVTWEHFVWIPVRRILTLLTLYSQVTSEREFHAQSQFHHRRDESECKKQSPASAHELRCKSA